MALSAFGAMSDCMSPRDQIAKLRFTKRTWIYDLEKKVRTGDIVLFNSKHSTSNITKFFTKAKWDHIGIVVRPAANQTFLLEWGGGLFVCPFVERMVEYHETDARLITVRQLQLGKHRSAVEDKMEAFVDMLLRNGLGQNAGIKFGEVYRAWQVMGTKTMGAAGKGDQPVEDDLENLFCSKTVAVCYKSVGLIAANRDASLFLPKHFVDDAFLDLQGGASLGPELDVSFEPRAIRKFTVALLELKDPVELALRRKQKAAAVVQRSARRWQAKMEVQRRKEANKGGGFFGLFATKPEHTAKERRSLLKDLTHYDATHERPPLAESYSEI